MTEVFAQHNNLFWHSSLKYYVNFDWFWTFSIDHLFFFYWGHCAWLYWAIERMDIGDRMGEIWEYMNVEWVMCDIHQWIATQSQYEQGSNLQV